MKKITIFCGSNSGNDPVYGESCEKVAQLLISKNIELVYGGGRLGLMGKLADSVLKLGGKVTGVIPERLVGKEIAHEGLSELIVVGTMHERKAKMIELSDGFIALPGGIGTIEEIMEVYTWTQLGYQQKPCGLLNVNHFYDFLIRGLDEMVQSGFLRAEHRSLLIANEDADILIDQMKNTEIIYQDKWIR